LVLADYLGIEVPEGKINTHADPQTWPRLWRQRQTIQRSRRVTLSKLQGVLEPIDAYLCPGYDTPRSWARSSERQGQSRSE